MDENVEERAVCMAVADKYVRQHKIGAERKKTLI